MKHTKSIWDVFIILNDFDTRDNNVTITELGEKEPSSLKYGKSSAYGQDGYTKTNEEAYKGFTRSSRLLFRDEHSYSRFIDKYYSGLDVEVYYSDDNGRYRKGVIEEITDEIITGSMREIVLSIDLQPFKYESRRYITINKMTELVNLGNVYTLPIIKVYGNGKGKVFIGNQVMELDVDGSLLIDCKKIEIFNSHGSRANSKRISGDFFRINERGNTINYDGAITKLEIELNWRWR